jgi:hypothetical protein
MLRVAKLGLAQFGAADQHLPAARELRHAIAKAEDDSDDSVVVEDLRAVIMSVPELEALLRKEFPEGAFPPPFDLEPGPYYGGG